MKYLVLLILVFAPFNAHAALTYLGSGSTGNSTGLSHSASIVIPSGTDFLFICAYHNALDILSPTPPNAATVAGASATLIASQAGNQDTGHISAFYYLSPPSGSQTVDVSGATGGNGVLNVTTYVWAAYSGAKQSGQPDSFASVAQTNTTAKVFSTTVVAANSWLVLCDVDQVSGFTNITGGTRRVAAAPDGGVFIGDSDGSVGTGSQSLTVNYSA